MNSFQFIYFHLNSFEVISIHKIHLNSFKLMSIHFISFEIIWIHLNTFCRFSLDFDCAWAWHACHLYMVLPTRFCCTFSLLPAIRPFVSLLPPRSSFRSAWCFRASYLPFYQRQHYIFNYFSKLLDDFNEKLKNMCHWMENI